MEKYSSASRQWIIRGDWSETLMLNPFRQHISIHHQGCSDFLWTLTFHSAIFENRVIIFDTVASVLPRPWDMSCRGQLLFVILYELGHGVN